MVLNETGHHIRDGLTDQLARILVVQQTSNVKLQKKSQFTTKFYNKMSYCNETTCPEASMFSGIMTQVTGT